MHYSGKFRRLMLAILLATAFLLAAAGKAWAQDFEGVYLGTGAGFAHYNLDISNEDYSLDASAEGARFGVLAGSSTVLDNNIYLALEGHLGYHEADFSLETEDDLSMEGDVEETYGATLQVGRITGENVLTYGLLGWQQTNIDIDSHEPEEWSTDETFDGFRMGAGMEYQFDARVFLRGEYSYTLYGSESMENWDVDPGGGAFHISLGWYRGF